MRFLLTTLFWRLINVSSVTEFPVWVHLSFHPLLSLLFTLLSCFWVNLFNENKFYQQLYPIPGIPNPIRITMPIPIAFYYYYSLLATGTCFNHLLVVLAAGCVFNFAHFEWIINCIPLISFQFHQISLIRILHPLLLSLLLLQNWTPVTAFGRINILTYEPPLSIRIKYSHASLSNCKYQ